MSTRVGASDKKFGAADWRSLFTVEVRVPDKNSGVPGNDRSIPADHTALMINIGHAHHAARALQAPLRSTHARDPDQAAVVDIAWTEGVDSLDLMSGRVHFGSHATASIEYGVHWAIGGAHAAPVSGDLLCAALARDCFEATRACSTGGVYVNFLTEEEGSDRIEAAYGRPNLARLATLKRKFDPDNLFRHTIPVGVSQ